jgi:magnesium-transporting ATPase (P-type)
VGAVAYAMELLMAVMGTKQRWRTMPWMVLAFGVLVVPLGGVSLFFIIIQPIVIGTWCSLCLLAGVAMLVMIPYSLDELVASGQFLLDARRRGKPFWRTFWMGDAMEGGSEDRSANFTSAPRDFVREMLQGGVNWPWTLLASSALGIGLMFTRLLFGTGGSMADSDHLVGALVVTVAVSAAAEVARPLRFVNVLFGLWLIAAPWWLEGWTTPLAAWASVAVGAALCGLAIPRGSIRSRYGSWDRFIV